MSFGNKANSTLGELSPPVMIKSKIWKETFFLKTFGHDSHNLSSHFFNMEGAYNISIMLIWLSTAFGE